MVGKETIKLQVEKPVRIRTWKVEEGTIVYEGRVVLIYEEEPPGSKIVKLKSRHVGTVSKLCVQEGDTVNPGSPIFEIDIGCSHPTVINDLCAECGADLQKDGMESQATIPMVHSIPQLKVSHEQAQRIGRADTERLLKDKKLVLLVDLDQTLIHTTHDNIPNNLKDVHHFQLFGSQNPWYHTRLRPGTRKFLEEMNKLYELHICTFGVRPYAHMVAHILDKDAKLFSNRILSRDECFDFNSKHANLHALFPCGDELVCIIDDREDVWNYSPNLIPVKPYHFFKNTGDINDPNLPASLMSCPREKVAQGFLAKGVRVKEPVASAKGEDPLKSKDPDADMDDSIKELVEESDIVESIEKEVRVDAIKENDMIDVEDEDDYLLYLEDILRKVHRCFYKVYSKKMDGDADVKWVLRHLKHKVLNGCEIVFSGVVPLKHDHETSEPWLMAGSLGARVTKDLTPSTTHLVAANSSTAKVHKAKKQKSSKIHVVNPAWLIRCAHTWTHAEERLYPVINGGAGGESGGEAGGPCMPLLGVMGGLGGAMPFRLSGGAKSPQIPAITLSREEMDAMTQEVEDDSSTDSNQDKSEEEDSNEDDSTEDWSLMAHQLEQGLGDP